MADPFVAEIRIFAFQFAPKGWAQCHGQLLPLSQNTALFSLLGTTYGGDGKSTFALPDLQGSVPLHPGQGPGLSLYDLGQTGGSEIGDVAGSRRCRRTATRFSGPTASPIRTVPAARSIGRPFGGGSCYIAPARRDRARCPTRPWLRPAASLPHNNMMPYLTLMFCIAMQGVFPPRP